MFKANVVMTGGGTAGHVMLNIALLPYFKNNGYRVHYIGSTGMERDLIGHRQDVSYHAVLSGKLRRYFSIKNALDMLKVTLSIVQCFFVLLRIRPCGVFSKGGYVAVPVCIAARILGIPVVTHESDYSPGLATKIIAKFATLVLTSFNETCELLPVKSVRWVGAPIREELRAGDAERGRALCGFDKQKPIVLVSGGSLGAERINQAIECGLSELLKHFYIIHLTGKGKKIFAEDPLGYQAFEYVDKELADLLAASDLIVGRAGSNSIFEFLSLNKPMLLIPLQAGSRGDQVDNTKLFVKKGWALALYERRLNADSLLRRLLELNKRRDELLQAQKSYDRNISTGEVFSIIVDQFC